MLDCTHKRKSFGENIPLLPLMKMLTLRVLDFAMTDVLARWFKRPSQVGTILSRNELSILSLSDWFTLMQKNQSLMMFFRFDQIHICLS